MKFCFAITNAQLNCSNTKWCRRTWHWLCTAVTLSAGASHKHVREVLRTSVFHSARICSKTKVVQNTKDQKNTSWGIEQKLLFLHAVRQLLFLHACLLDVRRHSVRLEDSRRIASADTIDLSEQCTLNCNRSAHQPWHTERPEDGRQSTLSWWSLRTTPPHWHHDHALHQVELEVDLVVVVAVG